MMIELSPILLALLDRANDLHRQAVLEDDRTKSLHLHDQCRADMVMVVQGVTLAVEAQRAAAGD